ncbi:hypothetical protein K435DRAFT_858156 [Dendrothele bispora CBS 962.96]|uniref:Uncharacterized protein n=1 Tax=Dendrothele bispora (strain CBS 962.96) TaxID=1314807 RepID=A0A4S8M541_DENBC|nr:hypothetical protein K435DRAFT_858156 [Dendrothele bispora CBS 962.96]
MSSTTVTVCKPPQELVIPGRSVFLAGSIEMGKAEDWQAQLTSILSKRQPCPPHLGVLVILDDFPILPPDRIQVLVQDYVHSV